MDAPQNHDGRSQVHHPSTAESLSKVEGEESSKQTSDLVDSDDGSLDGSSLN